MSAPSPAEERPDPRVGTVIGERYRIDGLLGVGGMGRVYDALHIRMKKRVAVKVLHRELTTVTDVVARFEREAMAAANIDHPNVATATDFGKTEDGCFFLVLEYVEGQLLRDEIKAGPMRVDRALGVARQIASALAAAHALKIVHRDLKPENVILVDKRTEKDFVKVLDFGIARVPLGERNAAGEEGESITKAGMVFGTPEYMAPEQALGQAVDERADLYALGVMLYEMLAGVRPFKADNAVSLLGQQIAKDPPPFRERAPGVTVPPAVERLVMTLLAREAGHRLPSAAQTLLALDELLGLAPRSAQATPFMGVPRSDPTAARISAFGPAPGSGPRPSQTSYTGEEAGSRPSFSFADEVSSVGTHPGYRPGDGTNPGVRPSYVGGTNPGVGAHGRPSYVDTQLDPSAGPGSGEQPGTSPTTIGVTKPPVDEGEGLSRVLGAIERFKAGLPKPLSELPAMAYIAAGAGGCILTFGAVLAVVTLVVVQSPTTDGDGNTASTSSSGDAPTVSVVKRAPKDEISAAKKTGPSALEELASRYPKDTEVLLELATAYRLERKYTKVVATVGRALDVDPAVRKEKSIARVLWQTAQIDESTDVTFTILEGPMREAGADIIYDLLVTKGVKAEVKDRAEKWTRSPAFEKYATPALKVAVRLRKGGDCKRLYELLEDAKKYGDSRSLKYLRKLQSRPCVRGRQPLREAIEAVEKRTTG